MVPVLGAVAAVVSQFRRIAQPSIADGGRLT
jgi:hypothetical protein